MILDVVYCGYCFRVIKLLSQQIKMCGQFILHVNILVKMYCVYLRLSSVLKGSGLVSYLSNLHILMDNLDMECCKLCLTCPDVGILWLVLERCDPILFVALYPNLIFNGWKIR